MQPTADHEPHNQHVFVNKIWKQSAIPPQHKTMHISNWTLQQLHETARNLSGRCQHCSELQSEDCCPRHRRQSSQSWRRPLNTAAVSVVRGTWSRERQQQNVALHSPASQWTAGALFHVTPMSAPVTKLNAYWMSGSKIYRSQSVSNRFFTTVRHRRSER